MTILDSTCNIDFFYCDWFISLRAVYSEGHPCCSILLFQGWVFHCMYVHFAYSFVYQWKLESLPALGYYGTTAVNMDAQVSIWVLAFRAFRYMCRSGRAVSYTNAIFNFLRYCLTVFHHSYTILHPYQKCTNIAASPNPLQCITLKDRQPNSLIMFRDLHQQHLLLRYEFWNKVKVF